MESPSRHWVLEAWKEKVYNQSDKIDPENERIWRDLAFGFVLGLGFKPDEAESIVLFISDGGYI